MTDNQKNKLPNNWTLKTLGEVCEILGGGTPSRNEPSFFGGNIAWITPTEINKEKINIISESKEYITEIGLKKSSARLLPVNSVLMTTRAGIGSVAISGIEVTTNQGFTSFVCSDKLNYFYLAYWLKFNRNEFEEKATGTTFKEISKTVIKNIQIPLPPLPEQQKIVQKIESLFTELETGTKALKTALVQLKIYRQAVLNHFLTNDKWETVKGESLFEYITSGSRGWADYYSEEGAIFLRITNLNFNTFLLDLRENKIQRVNLLNVKEGLRTKVQEGDFLISITGYLGMFAIVPTDFPEAYVNQHIALCRPKIGYDKKFVGYFITSKNGGLKQFNDMQKGATKAGLSLNDIRNLQIPLPSLKIQTQIVSEIEKRMAGADALETSLKAQLINAENLRQSILKRAFEGKLV